MANLLCFAVRDTKLNVFMTPFYYAHVGQALRAWQEICNDPGSMMCKHPSDFTLYEIGSFDDSNGVFTALPSHHRLSDALSVKQRPSDVPTLTGVN